MINKNGLDLIPAKPNHVVTIYTDGAYHADKNIIGWASVFVLDNEIREISGYGFGFSPTEAELEAVIHALKSTKKGSAVQLFTDSMEVVSGYRKQHSENFLWKTFNQLYRERFVTMKWVKGHNGNLYNEMADSLARKACTTLRKKI